MTKFLLATYLFTFINIVFGQKCECGKGIGSYGDDPFYIYEFPNSKSISFCGYLETKGHDSTFMASEFSVFTCEGKEKLASYSAIHSCKVTYGNNKINIDRITFLYNGPEKEWKEYTLAQRTISAEHNSIKITEERVILSIPEPNFFDFNAVLTSDFTNFNYKDMSDFLGQLEILALNKYPKAVELLFSKQLETGTNAATAEHLLKVKATYEWVIKGIKNEKYW